MEALKRALKNIKIIPHPDGNNNGVAVEIKPKEGGGYPSWDPFEASLHVTLEQRDIKGLKNSLTASVITTDILHPKGNLSFELEHAHSYLDSVQNQRNSIFKMSVFNSCKPSLVFTRGPGFKEVVPPTLVNRSGLKANITEDFTRQGKFSCGLTLEDITTTLSSTGPTGIDCMASLQANITRDNTKLVNGAIVGEKDVFQVDQSLCVESTLRSNLPVFNRHHVTSTRFIQLKQVKEGSGNPEPPVLVLHGHYGGCIGDVPSYDAFVLGGPYSVRGYSMGELGAAKKILELGAEIRIPVMNTHVYAFAEHGNDLGSSKDVKGNPIVVYKKVRHGSSFGWGVKLGQVRAEYAVDLYLGTESLFIRLGERY